MDKYRKKPVVIEAMEINYPNYEEFDKLKSEGVVVVEDQDDLMNYRFHIEIETLEGTMRGNFGDWLIRGVSGELYPCKPDIFAATYEKVEDTTD